MANKKLTKLSDYNRAPMDSIDRDEFELAVHQNYALRSQQPGLMLQRDLEKLAFEGIERWDNERKSP